MHNTKPYIFGIISGLCIFLIMNIFSLKNNYIIYNYNNININTDSGGFNNIDISEEYNNQIKDDFNKELKRIQFFINLYSKNKYKKDACQKIKKYDINNFIDIKYNLLSFNKMSDLEKIIKLQYSLLDKCIKNDKITLKIHHLKTVIQNNKDYILIGNKMDVIQYNKIINNLKNKEDISEKIHIIKQKKGSNTCVIDNMGMIIEYETGLLINKEKIYKDIGKKKGEFWNTGLLSINKYGGNFIEIEKNTYAKNIINDNILKIKENIKLDKDYKIIPEYNDFSKFSKVTNIKTGISSNIWYMKEILKNNKMVLVEIPMSIIYPNQKKWINSNIFHAITVISYNEDDDTILYINTLNGKLETLDFNELQYNKSYLKYPFRYLTGDFTEINNKYILNK